MNHAIDKPYLLQERPQVPAGQHAVKREEERPEAAARSWITVEATIISPRFSFDDNGGGYEGL